jgi:hypothetical protein
MQIAANMRGVRSMTAVLPANALYSNALLVPWMSSGMN